MKAVFVLIDAMGWAYVRDRDGLSDILPYKQELTTVLGFSSGAIPSILSGQLPQQNGHWNLFYFAPDKSPFWWLKPFTWLPKRFLNNRFPRRAIQEIARRLHKFGGFFHVYGVPVEFLPFFDICEKKDIYHPGGVPNSIFDELEASRVRYCSYSYHDLRDEQIVRKAITDLQRPEVNFYFIYLAELDAFLHKWCGDQAKVDEAMRRYEGWIRELYQAAKAGTTKGDLGFYVLSDHGMTPKRGSCDLLREINKLGLRMPKDYLALYDSTMARFWFFNEAARSKVNACLEKIPTGHIVEEAEQREFGIYFSDHRYGETIFLMDPGILIEPSYYGAKAPDGMHGFHPNDLFSSAAFMATQRPENPPRMLPDVHDLMLSWVKRLKNAAVRATSATSI